MSTITTATRRVAAAAAVSALSIPASLGVAGTATADAAAFRDARGDMSQGADIHKVRVVNEKRVRVKVTHRDLVRSFRSGSSIAVYIDTDPKRSGPEYVLQGATFEGGDYALLKADGFQAAGNRQAPLHGGSYLMRLDFDRDVARIAIDRVVLGNPGKVRVAVKTGAEMLPKGSRTPGPTEVDWLTAPETFTPWVANG